MLPSLPPTPWPLLDRWLDEAGPTEPRVPEAMQIATVSADGWPSLRTVLLKAHGPDGLVFYTHLDSLKGRQLRNQPRCSFLLHFKGLERQIRGQGPVEQVDDATADAYFASRPRGSQLGAWASPQSHEIPSRDDLLARVEAVTQRFVGREVPRPPDWSGFRILPHRVEFWQGREDRLHDRWLYVRDGSRHTWHRSLLAP